VYILYLETRLCKEIFLQRKLKEKHRLCSLDDAIYVMDGESQLKVCECVLLCVYKCTRACEQRFLLTRNCATLFIRRREIWKLLPAHLRCVSRSLQAQQWAVVRWRRLISCVRKICVASNRARKYKQPLGLIVHAAAGKWPRHKDSSRRPTW
jgi:hypothetical protein